MLQSFRLNNRILVLSISSGYLIVQFKKNGLEKGIFVKPYG